MRIALSAVLGVLGIAFVGTQIPTSIVRAASPDTAPPLPLPSANVVNVSTVSQLQAAVASLTSGRTVVIAPGRYDLTSTLNVHGPLTNVTIRGATNNRNDVVLVGRGMTNESYGNVPHGVWSGDGVTGLTIANLTIRDLYFHPIIFNAGTQAPRVYNVRLVNAGQQFIKSNPDNQGGGVNDGVVEYSVLEYDTTARDYYTNGVDILTAQNWTIRHNLFKRMRAPVGQLAGPAILAWRSSSGTVAEGNTFIDCQREIAFGLEPANPNDHSGGVIRNNFIVRQPGLDGDAAISIFDSPGTKVLHNTVLMSSAYPNAIEYRFPDTTGVLIANNLLDARIVARDSATATVQNNLTSATSALFVNPAIGDLHLQSNATAAIDAGIDVADAPADWDNEARPAGLRRDLGADEQSGSPGPPPAIEICGDGIDNDQDGQIDEGCALPARVPGPPGRLWRTVRGSTVTLGWQAPISGGVPAAYVLEVGLSSAPALYTTPVGLATSLTAPGVAAGRYVVRIRAVNAVGSGAPSNEVALSIGCTTLPRPPRTLTSRTNGNFVSLTWIDDDGCNDSSYVLLVGTAAGLANLAVVPLATESVAAFAPRGAYFVRAVTVSPLGATTSSNEVVMTVGSDACASPSFQTELHGRVSGRLVMLEWTPSNEAVALAADSLSPISYLLEVGTIAGLVNVGAFPIGRSTVLATTAPPGTYHVRIRPVDQCGSGVPSNDVVLDVF